MKKIFFLPVFALLLSAVTLSAQKNGRNKTFKGSGNVVTKDIPVKSFDELNISGVFSVLLTQGDKEGVKIEAEDNLQELFEVRNDGSELVISMMKNINIDSKKKMRVYITFKKLKSMDLKTVGDLSSDQTLNFDDLRIDNKSVGAVDLKMTTQTLNVQNKSVGDVTLGGSANSAIIKNNGVGSIQAASFLVQTMDIENTGVGSAEVNAVKELKVKDSFLGKVTNKGSAAIKRTNKVVI